MLDTLVIATDGSESVGRAVTVALDLARRFDADVHALYVVDTGQVESSPAALREDLRLALERRGETATASVAERSGESVTTALRTGRPAREIVSYAREVGADVVAMGTRGYGGDGGFLVGSVAERVVRTAPMPVLTVRDLRG